jgi:hypothetical protein
LYFAFNSNSTIGSNAQVQKKNKPKWWMYTSKL